MIAPVAAIPVVVRRLSVPVNRLAAATDTGVELCQVVSSFFARSSLDVARRPVRVAVRTANVTSHVIVTNWTATRTHIADRTMFAFIIGLAFHLLHRQVATKANILRCHGALLVATPLSHFARVHVGDAVRTANGLSRGGQTVQLRANALAFHARCTKLAHHIVTWVECPRS